MSHLQPYTKLIKMPTLQTYLSEILTKLKHTQNRKTSHPYVLNWRSSYDVVFMCQSRHLHFVEF